jgi:hypothetical protein
MARLPNLVSGFAPVEETIFWLNFFVKRVEVKNICYEKICIIHRLGGAGRGT